MSDNPQFKRTDKAIIRALIALLRHKTFESITVQDILNETPVTRATFYAHFRDKYDIAETMMDQFVAVRESVRRSLAEPDHSLQAVVRQNTDIDREFILALLKIHTEKVDFRRVIARELEKEYLLTSDSPDRELEARIYARAQVELYLQMLESDEREYPPERVYEIFTQVSLHLLHLSHDRETRAFLASKAHASRL